MKSPDRTIRVAVADGMPLFRRGAIQAIEEDPGLAVVAEAGDGDSALHAILDSAPDVAIIDVGIPGLGGPAVMRGLSRAQCPTKVILTGADADATTIKQALTSGVSGYVSKNDHEQALRSAIRAVVYGGSVIPDSLRTRVVEQLSKTAGNMLKRLSAREQTTLELLAASHSAKDIGRRLNLSESTVKTYQRRLYEKLEVSTRSMAVAEGFRRGLID